MLPKDFVRCISTYTVINFSNYVDEIIDLNQLNMILFYDEFTGKKWNYFNSPKRCFLAYSNFQGKNELINYALKKLGIKNFNNIECALICYELIY